MYCMLNFKFYLPHLQINLKIISSKSYKPLADLQQKQKPSKEIIGSVHFLIDKSTYILWYKYF